jgi:predicted acylesterase/phospholipase RssA
METSARKVGLVVSGGGARGAFAVGALQYLIQDLGLTFDMAAGSSTGSLIVPMVLADRLDVVVDIYSNVTTPEVVTWKWLPFSLFGDSLMSVRPLQALIEEHLTEEVWQKLQGARTTFVTTTNLQTGENVFWKAGGARLRAPGLARALRPGLDRRTMIRAILASCCQPIFMPPIVVDPSVTPLEQHVDGGLRDVAPAQVLIDHGVTDLYVIDLSSQRQPRERTVYRDLLSIFGRGLALFQSEITRGDLGVASGDFGALRYLDEAKGRLAAELGVERSRIDSIVAAVPDDPWKGLALRSYTLIQPLDPLPITNPLDFDPRVMRQVMATGYARARELLPRPQPQPRAMAAE